jgi:hypothetical protein
MDAVLELEDIQHYLLTRPHAAVAQYNFITFRNAESGRRWLRALTDIVGTADTVLKANEQEMRWVSLALTFEGLRTLGVDEGSLETFPEPFRQGMAARASILGDAGIHHPDHCIGKIILQVKIFTLWLSFLPGTKKNANDAYSGMMSILRIIPG